MKEEKKFLNNELGIEVLKPNMRIFIIPFKTPTINHLYWHRGNMKVLTKEAKELRVEIDAIVEPAPELQDKKLKVIVYIHEDWYTKKGEVKRKDIANREKFLIDSVFSSMGIDDRFIFEHHIYKIQDNAEFSIIEVEEIL